MLLHHRLDVPLSAATPETQLEIQTQSLPTLVTLIDRLQRAVDLASDVIPWASPVPSFGPISQSKFATLGLNPSNREFVDERGRELDGGARRFQTLTSLGLKSWREADTGQLRSIAASCNSYFSGNPYNIWFKPLDSMMREAGGTFYGPSANACHLDLIPFATARKWTQLSNTQRADLLTIASDTLALLLQDSPSVQVIILNGRTVVEEFESMASVELRRQPITGSTLLRKSGRDIEGVGFVGTVSTLKGIPLDREILVLGYNHNIQSSFGVTRAVTTSIGKWIADTTRKPSPKRHGH